MTRSRLFLILTLGLGVCGAAALVVWPKPFYALITQDTAAETLTAIEAFEAARAGTLVLVDIRRPTEWAATGSGQGAVRMDMRRPDFVQALLTLTEGDRDAPIALICARGVRSAQLSNQLVEAGFTQISDVPEGMLGSAAGPGWIEQGLPLDRSP